MKKYICAIWPFIFVMAGHLCAQKLVIKDRQTGKPLESVVMSAPLDGAFAVTDVQGQVDISGFVGADSIIVRHVGYRSAVVSYDDLQSQGSPYYMTPFDITLENVVISAAKWRQPVEQVPYRVTGIMPAQVALQNPQTAADMLALTGEVYMQKSQQGGGSPMIRGFSANRLLYAVDGVRMNTAILRSGNVQNVISLDPFSIENAEVLFGPGSVIYGSDAIGGVMAFQTKTPALHNAGERVLSGKATLRVASANNERTGHIELGYGKGKWAGHTSMTGFGFGDLRMGQYGPETYKKAFYVERIGDADVVVDNPDPLVQVPTAYNQFNVMQKLRYVPAGQWDLRYGFHYSSTSDFARYDRLIILRDSVPQSAEWRYGPQVWMMNHFSVNHVHKGLYDQMTLRIAHQYFVESRIDRGYQDNWRRRREEAVHALSLNLDFAVAPSTRLDVFYGLECVVNKVHSTGMETNIQTGQETEGPSRYPEAWWTSLAAYTTAQYRLSNMVMLYGGIRYNHILLTADLSDNAAYFPLPATEADLSAGALTGSAGLLVYPQNHWKLGLNLSSGFRAPNVDDVGKIFDSEPGAVVVPNTTLGPEYAYNVELSSENKWNDAVRLYASVYYTLLNNAMVRKDYQLNGADSIVYDGTLSRVQAIQNAAAVHVGGLQAGFDWTLPFDIVVASKINYQYGREIVEGGDNVPARHAAPLFGITTISYKRKGLWVQLGAEYNGPILYRDLAPEERGKPHLYAVDENGNPYAPGWYTLNLNASYRWNGRWVFTAGIDNITSQRYRTYSSGIASAGRNFKAGITVDF
jgi:hemoglobin/transferrin/lactoferrin receptor protein